MILRKNTLMKIIECEKEYKIYVLYIHIKNEAEPAMANGIPSARSHRDYVGSARNEVLLVVWKPNNASVYCCVRWPKLYDLAQFFCCCSETLVFRKAEYLIFFFSYCFFFLFGYESLFSLFRDYLSPSPRCICVYILYTIQLFWVIAFKCVYR